MDQSCSLDESTPRGPSPRSTQPLGTRSPRTSPPGPAGTSQLGWGFESRPFAVWAARGGGVASSSSPATAVGLIMRFIVEKLEARRTSFKCRGGGCSMVSGRSRDPAARRRPHERETHRDDRVLPGAADRPPRQDGRGVQPGWPRWGEPATSGGPRGDSRARVDECLTRLSWEDTGCQHSWPSKYVNELSM